MSTSLPLADRLNRPIGVLRLSLTARGNLACPYCCPDVEEPPGLLTLEQQIRVIRVATRLGAQTLRLTGGEPLLSRRLLPLLEAVAQARRDRSDPMAGLQTVALTSNGVLLSEPMARALRAAWLASRVVPWLGNAWCARCRTASRRPAPLALTPHAVGSSSMP